MINRFQIYRHIKEAFLRLTFISILLFSFSITTSEANNHSKNEIIVIIPNDSDQYTIAVQSIRKSFQLNKNIENVRTLYLSDPTIANVKFDDKKLVVLVGSSAFNYYAKSNAKSPYLTTLITKSAFEYIFKRANNKKAFIGGVMIDQPTKKYTDLTNALIPSSKRIGLVIGPERIKNKQKLLENINTKTINYSFVEIAKNDNPVNKLRNAYESNQALIVFPDRKKFNRSLSRWILTLSYQYKIPLISYSKKYAEAGALASLYSTPDKIGKQTAEIMIPYLKNTNNKNQKLDSPKYFDIHVNQSVANALGIDVPPMSELLRKISK